MFGTGLESESKRVWLSIVAFTSSTALIMMLFLLWDEFNGDLKVCRFDPFSDWTKRYSVFFLGATAGQTLILAGRFILSEFSYRSETVRHFGSMATQLIISTIATIAQLGTYYDFHASTCVDHFGVKSSPYLWLDWTATVPPLLFMSVMMDMNRSTMRRLDVIAVGTATVPVYLLFFTNFPLPEFIKQLFFFLANIFMCGALYLQHMDAYTQLMTARTAFDSTVTQKQRAHGMLHQSSIRDLTVAQCKLTVATFITVSFCIYPSIYYARFMGWIDDDANHIAMLFMNFIVKCLFLVIIADCHTELLDPTKFRILEEKQRADEARVMFLRYVFHEVRVPLNSVSLGVQVLQESESMNDSDIETLSVIQEAICFMSETLNDVLSLQKIEQGMLDLDCKPFKHEHLTDCVLSNFRSQYESKGISVYTIIEADVVPWVKGDRFRLEHVLGNLLSNALKFSDAGSRIIISVANETEVVEKAVVEHVHPQKQKQQKQRQSEDKEKDTKKQEKKYEHIRYSVRDFGPGMTQEDQKMLFQPFMQIRPGELQKGRGSGLGLSICKNIIKLHQGTIGCNSKTREECLADGTGLEASGSTFYFSIQFEVCDPAKISADGATYNEDLELSEDERELKEELEAPGGSGTNAGADGDFGKERIRTRCSTSFSSSSPSSSSSLSRSHSHLQQQRLRQRQLKDQPDGVPSSENRTSPACGDSSSPLSISSVSSDTLAMVSELRQATSGGAAGAFGAAATSVHAEQTHRAKEVLRTASKQWLHQLKERKASARSSGTSAAASFVTNAEGKAGGVSVGGVMGRSSVSSTTESVEDDDGPYEGGHVHAASKDSLLASADSFRLSNNTNNNNKNSKNNDDEGREGEGPWEEVRGNHQQHQQQQQQELTSSSSLNPVHKMRTSSLFSNKQGYLDDLSEENGLLLVGKDGERLSTEEAFAHQARLLHQESMHGAAHIPSPSFSRGSPSRGMGGVSGGRGSKVETVYEKRGYSAAAPPLSCSPGDAAAPVVSAIAASEGAVNLPSPVLDAPLPSSGASAEDAHSSGSSIAKMTAATAAMTLTESSPLLSEQQQQFKQPEEELERGNDSLRKEKRDRVHRDGGIGGASAQDQASSAISCDNTLLLTDTSNGPMMANGIVTDIASTGDPGGDTVRSRRSSSSSSTSSSVIGSSSSPKNAENARNVKGSGKFPPVGNIMLVDDVLSNRKMLNMILAKKGQTSIQRQDGREAVETVKELGVDHFQIIFMDSMMPVMTGTEAAELIREMGYRGLMIGVTGNAMDVDVKNFEQAGVDMVLTKPLRMEQLALVLRYCIEVGTKSFYGLADKKGNIKDWMSKH